MTWRVAIVGLGQIGLQADIALEAHHVYSHARAFSTHPAFELVAGVDADAANRAMFESACKRPAFAEVEQLAALAPDLVTIAVPTNSHASVLEQVLAQCQPRAILCEKPLAYDLNHARRMVEACERAGCLLMVNYMRRADPAVTEVKQRLDDGRIPGPVKGLAWYSKGLFNNGSHFLDLLQYWLGPLQSHQVIQPGRRVGADIEPDFLARFSNGEVVFLAAKEENFSHYTVELISPGGRLRYDHGGEKVSWQPAIESATSPGYRVLDEVHQPIAGDLTRIQWQVAEQLAHLLQGKPTTLCSARQALDLITYITSIGRTS